MNAAALCLIGLFGCARSAEVVTPHAAPPPLPPEEASPAAPVRADVVAVEIRGPVVTVAGEAVPSDLLSLRGALARHRGRATTAEVLLVDPKEEIIDELVRGAAATELGSLAFTRDGSRIEVLLAPHDRATHEARRTADGREHVRAIGPEPDGADLAVWLPGDATEESAAREKLREACATRRCLIRAVRVEQDGAPLVSQFLSSWQRLARGEPQLQLALRYAVVRGKTTVSGRLPPEVIQRTVRENFELFRKCYEAGLGRDAKLTGRVTVRFVIGRDGKVSNVTDGGSDIPDTAVRECVFAAFDGLQFPAPEGGIVTVVYPILFAPG